MVLVIDLDECFVGGIAKAKDIREKGLIKASIIEVKK